MYQQMWNLAPSDPDGTRYPSVIGDSDYGIRWDSALPMGETPVISYLTNKHMLSCETSLMALTLFSCVHARTKYSLRLGVSTG